MKKRHNVFLHNPKSGTPKDHKNTSCEVYCSSITFFNFDTMNSTVNVRMRGLYNVLIYSTASHHEAVRAHFIFYQLHILIYNYSKMGLPRNQNLCGIYISVGGGGFLHLPQAVEKQDVLIFHAKHQIFARAR